MSDATAPKPSTFTIDGQETDIQAGETIFRAACYVLIAAAVIIGLPALDGVLR